MSDYFIFDDIDTRNYEGIYVYFDDVDATPSRVGAFIDIPGRNGSFYLDKGRFEDVTHTYDIIALTKEVGSDLINAIASKVGYHRLEDSFNPDEFYSAVFVSEIEPTVPTDRSQVAFKLMFTRKPQRFLKSGEIPVEMVGSGALVKSITNPTLFESSPLFAITGDGSVRIGTDPNHISEYDYSITLNDESVGYLVLLPVGEREAGFTQQAGINHTVPFDSLSYALTEDSDSIKLSSVSIGLAIKMAGNQTLDSFTVALNGSHGISNFVNTSFEIIDERTRKCNFNYGEQTWAKENGNVLYEDVYNCTYVTTTTDPNTGTTTTQTRTFTATIQFGFRAIGRLVGGINFSNVQGYLSKKVGFKWSDVTTDSTQSVLGNPTYIDCDIGEAYKIMNGEIISLNRYIELGSKLPVLVSGVNTIIRTSTAKPTSILMTPRWWKI